MAFAKIGFATALAGGVLTWLLSPVPFGIGFRASLYATLGGVLVCLVASSVSLLRGRRVCRKLVGAFLLLAAILISATWFIVAIDLRILVYQRLSPRPTAEQWQEDLDHLAAAMRRTHPGLFALISEQRFEHEVARARTRISSLNDDQVMFELFRIAALPNDAHTFPFIFSPAYDLHFYPLKIFPFDDGTFVTDAGRAQRQTIGSRVIEVAGVPIEELEQRFCRYVAAENEYGEKDRCGGLPVAEWMEALGLVKPGEPTPVLLEDPRGRRYEVGLDPVPQLPWLYWYAIRPVENPTSPAITNDRKDNFWFEYRPDDSTFYFQFNQSVNESNGESIEAFLGRLGEDLATRSCERFIVDLRNNGGGNLDTALRVADFVKNNEAINRRGKLFVLIGRRTFSAAVSLASMLRNNK